MNRYLPLVLVCLSSLAGAGTPEEWSYGFSGEKIILKKYYGKESKIKIPEKLYNSEVAGIGPSAFRGNEVVEEVIMPEGITKIGEDAFAACPRLTRVVIPDSVKQIGASAFRDCPNLTDVSLGQGVSSLGAMAFADCPKIRRLSLPAGLSQIGRDVFASYGKETELSEILVDPGNPDYSSQEGVFFNKNKTVLLVYPAARRLENYPIPDGVVEIGEGAFAGNLYLTNVTFPASLRKIGPRAFQDCQSLANLRIPQTITSIQSQAFHGCPRLTNVVFESLQNIVVDLDAFPEGKGMPEGNPKPPSPPN